MNLTIFWLIVFIILVAIELATMGLTTIWFAGGALVAIIAAAFRAPILIQIVLFILVSVILLLFTRPIAVKYFNKDRIKTNIDALIGKQAIVISEVDNLQGIGQVTVEGQEWTARTQEDHKILVVGTVVEVVEIHGVKLIVREKGEN